MKFSFYLTGDEVKNVIYLILIFLLLFSFNVEATEKDYIDEAIDKIDFNTIEEFFENNNDYFKAQDYNLIEIVKGIISGKFPFKITDYIKYVISNEINYFKDNTKNCINILIIAVILTIINYFSKETNNKGVSDIVFTISIMIVFSIVIKDLNKTRLIIDEACLNMEEITSKLNSVFLTIMITFGKLSIMQFFHNYSNYIINLTTKIIFVIMNISSCILIVIIIINNISDLFDFKLLYKFVKKTVIIIVGVYIFIVVINFSVQGYILYRTDNVFINSIKALSPSSVPIIGNAINNLFGVFFKSLLLIKDILGFIFIVFILSAFGDVVLKILFIFLIYKITAVLVEPFNSKIANFINEMSDVFYIYLICYTTPIFIITIYYSIMLNYLNNVFG